MSTKLKASLIIIEAIYVLVYSAFLVGYVHNWGALVFFMFTGALAGVMILAIIITKVSQKKQRIRLENRNMALPLDDSQSVAVKDQANKIIHDIMAEPNEELRRQKLVMLSVEMDKIPNVETVYKMFKTN